MFRETFTRWSNSSRSTSCRTLIHYRGQHATVYAWRRPAPNHIWISEQTWLQPYNCAESSSRYGKDAQTRQMSAIHVVWKWQGSTSCRLCIFAVVPDEKSNFWLDHYVRWKIDSVEKPTTIIHLVGPWWTLSKMLKPDLHPKKGPFVYLVDVLHYELFKSVHYCRCLSTALN